MRFFSKIAFLCNLCFLVSIPLRMWEQAAPKTAKGSEVVTLQPLISSVAVLGVLAILVNLFFLLLFFYRYKWHRMAGVTRFILIFNLLVLPFQVYYFFFSK